MLALVALGSALSTSLADNWSEWRGGHGNGRVGESNLPVEWSSDRGILWETELPAPGNSSPIVFGDRLFLTGANDDGTERSLMSFDRANGKLQWKRSVSAAKDDPTHPTNPWCAASPATDGERVYVWNGSAGASAYDFAGKQVWHRDLGTFVHQWGHASSPRIYKDTVIIFGGPGPRVVLTALNKFTGKTVWEQDLNEATSPPAEVFGSFVTPLVWKNGSRPELLIPLPGYLASFNPETGEELWRCEGIEKLAYSDALVGDGVLLAFSGFRGPSIGMRMPGPDERGNLTESHRLWKNDTILPRVSSGVIVGDHFFLCGVKGELHCGHVRTGKILWTHKLRHETWSAISLVDDLLYLTDQACVTHIFEPSDQFRLIRKNAMRPHERTNSTLAFSDGELFLRTHERLYAIGKVKER